MEAERLLCKSCGGRLEQRGQDYYCPACGYFRVDEQGNFRPVDGPVPEPDEPDGRILPSVDEPAEARGDEADGLDTNGRAPTARPEPIAADDPPDGKADPESPETRNARRLTIEIQIGDGD